MHQKNKKKKHLEFKTSLSLIKYLLSHLYKTFLDSTGGSSFSFLFSGGLRIVPWFSPETADPPWIQRRLQLWPSLCRRRSALISGRFRKRRGTRGSAGGQSSCEFCVTPRSQVLTAADTSLCHFGPFWLPWGRWPPASGAVETATSAWTQARSTHAQPSGLWPLASGPTLLAFGASLDIRAMRRCIHSAVNAL